MFDMKKWRLDNKEHLRNYAREYRKKKPKIIARLAKKWRIKNRDKYNAYRRDLHRRKYESRPDYVVARINQGRRWRRKNPKFSTHYSRIARLNMKGKARIIFSNAIQSGKIIRPDKCSKCFKKVKIQGHHRDYSKPLSVVWLCSRCHGREHSHKSKSMSRNA